MKRVLLATAALAAAVVVLILVRLPPSHLALSKTNDDGTLPGVIHIHTNRSDGRSSPEGIAAAAARVGLKFIVFTDHGDATRTPDPPTYRSGVLCIDGVEISTSGGHYVAIGLPVAPYPLGGEPRDVVEDVARLGGFGIAAHPDSPKPELEWRGWATPFEGLEVVNLDTGWRGHAMQPGARPKLRLLEAVATYPIRPVETIAGLLGDSSQVISRWEALTRVRRVVAVAGADAHAKIALTDVDPGDNRFTLPLPSYESSFRTISVHVRPDRPLSGDATNDADAILQALRHGHVYTAVDAIATPPSFQFTAENQRGIAEQGDELPAGGPVTLRIRSNAPPDFVTTVWQGSLVWASKLPNHEANVAAPPDPAVYRVEIRSLHRPDGPPWIVSNPIYVRGGEALSSDPARPPAVATVSLFDGLNGSGWRVEEGESSRGVMSVVPGAKQGELRLQYELPQNASPGSYISLLVSVPEYLARYDRVTFSARADRPMRISVQVRTERAGVPSERWQRSVYVDTVARTRTVYFDDLTPIDTTRNRTPPLADMPYVLFVVDRAHTKPGSTGQIWITGVALQR